ncbi:MAG TPA: UbiA family prenyltransferase [Myxococcaceae bacterium]|nr:UbiA family prenyltransferase [Myxococcaceae bacterium]
MRSRERAPVHPDPNEPALGLGALRDFVRERFPPWATIPIAGLLHAAPASLGRPPAVEVAEGALATFLGLLCLRIADDLADLERDRVLHPQRGLCSGRIDRGRLLAANLALGATLVVLESTSGWRLAFFVGGCAFYRAWLRRRAHVHPVARPFLSNAVFPLAVLHGAGPGAWRPALLLGLFAWFAAVAHEFAHNVRTPEEDAPLGPGYARALGAGGTAVLGTALFATAALAAVLLWLVLGRPWVFGGALVGAAAGMAFFLARLLRDRGSVSARSLYRAGIVFALIPALGLLVGR